MKNIKWLYLITTLILTAAVGCKKNTTPSPPPAGDLTITDFSPKLVDFGDVVTIVGTGFNPDASQNEVLFQSFTTQVISASPTQLKVIVPDCSSALTPGYYTNIVVRTNGKQAVAVDEIYFKRAVAIIKVTTSLPGIFIPGDSLTIEGSGFRTNLSSNHVSIGNQGLTPVRVDSSYWCKMSCYSSAAGCKGGYDTDADTATVATQLKITNGGGTVLAEKAIRTQLFPRPDIQYVSYSQTLVGGYYSIKIKHKSILPGTAVRFTGGNVNSFSLMQSEYRDDYKEDFILALPSNLPAGTYQFRIVRGNTVYLSRSVTFI